MSDIQLLKQAIEKKDIPEIKAILISILDVDPGDKNNNFTKAFRYVNKEIEEQNIEDFFVSDFEEFDNDKNNWNLDYYLDIKSSLFGIFSINRISFLLEMGKHLYKDKTTVIQVSHKIDNKKLITIATVIFIGLIGGFVIYKLLK